MKHFKPRLPLTLLTAGLLAISACDSSTTEPDDDDDDHGEEVEGVVLTLSGETIASYDGEDGAWDAELEVEPGEETAVITVQFVDHEGHAVTLDDDFHLQVEMEDSSVAAFAQSTPGGYAGKLQGVAEGDTEVTFSLMHGAVGSGHADFVTAPLHVHVHEHEHPGG